MALNICFVGSGVVNFGGSDVPWNHSLRLEKIGGLKIVAIVDPLTERADQILAQKLSDSHAHLYQDCTVYRNIDTALKEKKINVAFVGVPPFCHGSFSDGKDLEIKLLQTGVNVFVEKPISVLPPEEFKDYVTMVTKVSQEHGCLVSVGYMFRYHPAIKRIKEELTKYGRPLAAINVRYASTYTNILKPFWWDKTQSGGPIVEQATHFCDLIRYLGGEVLLDSITGYSIPPSNSPQDIGYLKSLPSIIQEAGIPLENDAPRATQCVWQFAAGGIGTLTHTLLLHDFKYETSIDIWCDGLRISLTDLYFPECTLKIRRSGSNEESVETFPDADPYLEEDRAFIEAILSGKSDGIESLYEDAAKTYELSWAIRRATEK